MAVFTYEILIDTRGDGDIQDITQQVNQHLQESKLNNGTVTVFMTHSTAAVTTIEFEPGLMVDLHNLLEKLAPKDETYEHNQRWGDGNGYAHVRASLLGPSLSVPFQNHKLLLGTWQQIVLVEFDNRPRQRTIAVQVMGE